MELLNALVKETETMIALAQTRIDAAQTEYESLLASVENLRQEYDRLLTWADLFDTCSFEAKKMIVAQFVKAVRVSRDYNIELTSTCLLRNFRTFPSKMGTSHLQSLRSHTAKKVRDNPNFIGLSRIWWSSRESVRTSEALLSFSALLVNSSSEYENLCLPGVW